MSPSQPAALLVVFVLSSLTILGQANRGVETEGVITGPTGKVYALVVGVSDYEKDLIQDLKYASADARAFSEYLKAAPIKLEKIIELYDKDARKSAIKEKGLDKIDALVFNRVIKKDDLIILYFSGHGGSFTADESYFFPHDAEHTTDAGSSFRISWIKNMIDNWVRDSKANLMFVFDACRSKTLASESDLDLAGATQQLERNTGEILMAASQGGEPAQETSELKHGVFSYFLLEGLYGKADISGDGFISTAEIQNYVATNVFNKTKLQQQPMIKYPSGFQKRNMFAVDQKLLATVDTKLKMDLSNQSVILLAQKGGSNTEKAKQLSDLIGKFKESMGAARLIRPAGDCAMSYYRQMLKLVPIASLEDQTTDLSIALYEAALTVIKHDLNGERLYLRPGRSSTGAIAGLTKDKNEFFSSTKSGFNLNYYGDALYAIQGYIEMKKRNVEPVTKAMEAYLAGRQLTIRYMASDHKKEIKEAVSVLKKSTAEYSNQAFLWQGLAMAYREDPASSFAQAEEAAKKALALAPRWSFPLVTLGDCAWSDNRDAEAKEYFAKAIELNRADISALIFIGWQKSDAEDYSGAIEYYRKARAIDPKAPIATYNLGEAFFELEEHDSCLHYLSMTMMLDSSYNKVSMQFYYARALAGTGDLDGALRVYRKYLESNPDEPARTHNNIGSVLSLQSKYDEGIVEFKKAIALDSLDPLYPMNLSITYDRLSKKDEMIKYLRATLKVDPNYKDALYSLGLVLETDGKWVEAEDEFRKLIVLDSTVADNYGQIGQIYHILKKHREALEMFKHAARLDPADGWLQYWVAVEYLALNDPANARGFLNEASKLAEDTPELQAWISFRFGEESAAKKKYTSYMSDVTRDMDDYYEYAIFLCTMKDYDGSIKALKKSMELGYWGWIQFDAEQDFAPLRGRQDLKDLLAKYRK